MSNKVLLYISPTNYDEIVAKGTAWMFTDREEGGYFSKVITLHHVAKKVKVVRLSSSNIIYDIGGYPKWLWKVVALICGIYLCLKYNASIVRATDPFISGLMGWVIARLCRKPFCISIHSDYQQDYEIWGKPKAPKMWRWLPFRLMRFTLPKAYLVMPNDELFKEYAAQHGARRESLRAILHGVDGTLYRGRENIGSWNGKIAVVVVTRLSPDQYLDDLRNLALLMKDDSVVFVVVGDGQDRHILEGLANVRLLGWKTREQVAEILSSCDIGLCFSSGLRTIEMAISALPLVAYDIDWQKEIVKSGDCGILVGEHDIKGLAEGIRWCMSHSDEARRLGENGRKYTLVKYSIEATRKMKIACYEELLSERN